MFFSYKNVPPYSDRPLLPRPGQSPEFSLRFQSDTALVDTKRQENGRAVVSLQAVKACV